MNSEQELQSQQQAQELSNQVATLTQQLESLTNQFTTLKKEAVLEVSAQTAQSVQSGQKALIAELKETVENAVNNNQKLFSGKIELEEKKSSMTNKDWIQNGMLLLPFFTQIFIVLLGFKIWQMQSDIQLDISKQQNALQQQISNQDKILATQLSITQEFYKRKFDVYKNVNEKIFKLINALDSPNSDEIAESDAEKDEVVNMLAALKIESKSQRLYFHDPVAKGVEDVLKTAVECSQQVECSQEENETTKKLIEKTNDVQNLMLEEIKEAKVGFLGPIPLSSPE